MKPACFLALFFSVVLSVHSKPAWYSIFKTETSSEPSSVLRSAPVTPRSVSSEPPATDFKMVTENITAYHSPQIVEMLKNITASVSSSLVPELADNRGRSGGEATTTRMESDVVTDPSAATTQETTQASTSPATSPATAAVTGESFAASTSSGETPATFATTSGSSSTETSEKSTTTELTTPTTSATSTEDSTTTTGASTQSTSFVDQVNSNFVDMDTKTQLDNKKYQDVHFGAGSQEEVVTKQPGDLEVSTNTELPEHGTTAKPKRRDTNGQSALASNVLLLLVNLVFIRSLRL